MHGALFGAQCVGGVDGCGATRGQQGCDRGQREDHEGSESQNQGVKGADAEDEGLEKVRGEERSKEPDCTANDG